MSRNNGYIDSVSEAAGPVRSGNRPKPALDRLPPSSTESEQGVLGCILLSPNENLPEAIEKLPAGAETFYDLRHKTLFQTFLELYEDQIAIDTITVQERLKLWGKLEEVGGIAYLASLPDLVPSAANLDYYLDIVREKYLLRRAICVCTETVARVYEYEGDADELMDVIERDILDIGRTRLLPESRSMQDLVRGSIQRFEQAMNGHGALTGLATGFSDLDRMTGGLKGGEMIVIAARPSMGKAQPLTARVLTPSGFVEMGAISVGDYVIGGDGRPTLVVGVYPQGVQPTYTVECSDGTRTDCSMDHLWFTQTRNERRRGITGSVKSTSEIIETLRRGDGGWRNHALPTVRPVEFFTNQQLPIHPWLLGALLGDGTLRNGNIHFSKPEQDVQQKVLALLPSGDTAVVASPDGMTLRIKRRSKTNEPSTTKQVLEAVGLMAYSEDKFIPRQYLMASSEERLELLRGILDTDGYVLETGSAVEFCSSSPALARDVAFLSRSLGGICSEAEPRTPFYTHNGVRMAGLPSYRMNIWFHNPTLIPVSSRKHLAKWNAHARRVHKSIVSITQRGLSECQCIRVSAPDGLYVTDDFIVTHNTSLALNIADHVACELRLPVGIFSLEMTADALTDRLITSRARVNARNVRDGFLVDRDVPRLTVAAGRIAPAPIHIDDRSGLSILQIRAKARRWQQRYGIRLVIIDYLQLANALGSKRKFESRQQEVSDISTGIKSLAKELNVPVLALSQLNRDIEREKNRKPKLSDLRESGTLEQDADLVGFLYKSKPDSDEEDYQATEDAVPMNLLIAKQRNGPTGDVELTFMKTYTRFESRARVSDEDVPEQRTPSLPYVES